MLAPEPKHVVLLQQNARSAMCYFLLNLAVSRALFVSLNNPTEL